MYGANHERSPHQTNRSGYGESVRTPQEMAISIGTPVIVDRQGEIVTIRPAKKSMAWLIKQLRTLPLPGEIDIRDPIQFPERPGL